MLTIAEIDDIELGAESDACSDWSVVEVPITQLRRLIEAARVGVAAADERQPVTKPPASDS